MKKFLSELSDPDRASVLAAMAEIRDHGTSRARHLDGDIWEVRADGKDVIFRVLFSEEGEKSRILLALAGFTKKTQKTPPSMIKTAKDRLRDWRARA